MTDKEGFIAMLEEDQLTIVDLDLPPDPPDPPDQPDPPAFQHGFALTEEDWQDDAVPAKLDKIRQAFLNGKTAAEVRSAADMMPVAMWLDHVTKLAPKQIEVSSFQITAVRIELPPIELDSTECEFVDIELPG